MNENDHEHVWILLDEAAQHDAPSLKVCQRCGEVRPLHDRPEQRPARDHELVAA
jgi:hypothetical protein